MADLFAALEERDVRAAERKANEDRPYPKPHVFLCCRCGAPANYGFGVCLLKGITGIWYCREHAPLAQPGRAPSL